MAHSVDPDQMLHSAASDLGLHCLQRRMCPNTLGYAAAHCTESFNITLPSPGYDSNSVERDVKHQIIVIVMLWVVIRSSLLRH